MNLTSSTHTVFRIPYSVTHRTTDDPPSLKLRRAGRRRTTKRIFQFLGFFLLFSSIFSGCSLDSGYSSNSPKTSQNTASKSTKASKKTKTVALEQSTAPWRPSKENSIPFTMNTKVKQWIDTFNGSLKPNFTRWMGRLGQYGPTIEKILKEEGVPKDLIYLAMIESGFNMTAYSSASAAGPWQFISSTGKMYGLDNSFFVDERSAFEQATRAAARHLKDLHNVYGDWYLAFAAYNAGPGKVNGAIKKANSTDYWVLSSRKSRVLRQETKDYVPRILAAMYIVKNYKKYGYSEKDFGAPLVYDKVTVPDATDIHVLAKSANTSVDVIQALNPQLVRGITPPGEAFDVFIPHGAKEEFAKNYARIPASQRVSNLQYQAERGETLADLSKKFHVSTAQLIKTNNFTPKQELSPGQIIYVPATKTSLLAMRRLNSVSTNYTRTRDEVFYYKVKSGETLRTVAKKNKTSATSLARWNGLSKNARLKVGQSLKVIQKVKEKSSGTFIATNKTTGHVSGVKSIILNDGQDNLDLGNQDTDQVKVDVAQMVAMTEDTTTAAIEDLPAIIKTQAGDIQTFQPEQIDDASEDLENQKTVALKSITNKAPTKSQPQLAQNTAKQSSQTTTNKYHTVKQGETLSKIASRYSLKTSQLMALNNLSSATIRPEQKLIIGKKISTTTKTVTPTPNTPIVATNTTPQTTTITKPAVTTADSTIAVNTPDPTQNTTATTATTTTTLATTRSAYTVKSNDTLSNIAQKNNVTVADLKTWNNLISDTVRPGQKLKLGTKSQSSAKTTLAKSTAQTGVIYHKVQTGETLWSLSRKYNVKVSDIMKWNNLRNQQVQQNQKIKIVQVQTDTNTST